MTDTITDRHTRQRWPMLTVLLYLCFGSLPLVLFQKLARDGDMPALPLLGYPVPPAYVAFGLFVSILLIIWRVDLRPTCVRGLDWSLSKASALTSDLIQVRVMNLDRLPRRLPGVPMVETIESCEAAFTAKPPSPTTPARTAVESRRSRLRRFLGALKMSWWTWVDSLVGAPDLAVKWGSVATLLLGLGRFAAIGLLFWLAHPHPCFPRDREPGAGHSGRVRWIAPTCSRNPTLVPGGFLRVTRAWCRGLQSTVSFIVVVAVMEEEELSVPTMVTV